MHCSTCYGPGGLLFSNTLHTQHELPLVNKIMDNIKYLVPSVHQINQMHEIWKKHCCIGFLLKVVKSSCIGRGVIRQQI